MRRDVNSLSVKTAEKPSEMTNTDSIRVRVPGSKSITQRAMVAAALADGETLLKGPLHSEDTRMLRNAFECMGISMEDRGNDLAVRGQGGRLDEPDAEIFMGNNGTGIRFMTAVAGLVHGVTVLTGTERMGERPVQPLLDALSAWGVKAESIKNTGCPPVRIESGGLAGGEATLAAAKSSQFLSAMLLVAPYASNPAVVTLDGPLVSRPYVDITLRVMHAFGIDAEEEGESFRIPQGCYRPREYDIEGDASSASYFHAAAAITGGRVTVENLPENAMQGDAAFADILGMMGCLVNKGPGGVTVQGPPEGGLRGLEIDMGKWPDVVPTLAVVASFANGVTRITNAEHLRIKETDRLHAMATELGRIGVDITEERDGLVIRGGGRYHGAEIETYDDHRMAMCFAVASLRVPGIRVLDPDCVAKSFPEFWTVWKDVAMQLAAR